MPQMTPDRWSATTAYLADTFGALPENDPLTNHHHRAQQAGLPPIAISPDVGRLLSVLTLLVTRDPNATGRALEVGTLGGYSGIWIARALSTHPRGHLTTIEYDPAHARFAQSEFTRAGLADHVTITQGAALETLPNLATHLGPHALDLAFLDADKREYEQYAAIIKPLIRVGGLLIADNALGSSNWWIDDASADPSDKVATASRAAVLRFNSALAADPDFETCCVPIREGVLIAVRR